MKFGVVVFPGSNCDDDTVYVLRDLMGQQVVKLWHKDRDLQGCDFIVLPGGFSYGDYLRSGAIARFSPIMDKVIDFANGGGYLFGICNGFQVLVEAGLLPGVLLRNELGRFISRNVYLKPQTNNCLLTSDLDLSQSLKVPIAHAEGRYFADAETLQQLNANDQVLFRYCDAQGNISPEANPNGSLENIAGICNANRNVFGMMPHPERAAEVLVGNADGRLILDSLLKAALV
jgi:phosphoribosylformylglycinamidine synthase subunit PurQ / glutaminase